MKLSENQQKSTFQGDFSGPALKITVFCDIDLLEYSIENTKSKSEHSDVVGGLRKLKLKVPIFQNLTDFREDFDAPPSNSGKNIFSIVGKICLFLYSVEIS